MQYNAESKLRHVCVGGWVCGPCLFIYLLLFSFQNPSLLNTPLFISGSASFRNVGSLKAAEAFFCSFFPFSLFIFLFSSLTSRPVWLTSFSSGRSKRKQKRRQAHTHHHAPPTAYLHAKRRVHFVRVQPIGIHLGISPHSAASIAQPYDSLFPLPARERLLLLCVCVSE